jgi:hypothetical protein
MPLKGEYESTMQFVRDQVELYESSGGTEGTTLQDLPVIILTTVGAKAENPQVPAHAGGAQRLLHRGFGSSLPD